MNKVSEFFSAKRDDAQALAGKSLNSARDTAAAARNRIETTYGQARAATADVATKGREQAGQIAESASAAFERGKAKAVVATDKAMEFADKQPLTALIGALATGALIGALLPKSHKHEEDEIDV